MTNKKRERYLRIGQAIMRDAGVEDWHFHNGNEMEGMAWSYLGRIVSPNPTTRFALYVLAHESGHVALRHNDEIPRHRREFEAEIYAHEALRRHGLAVPRNVSSDAKEDVALRIELDVRRGAKELDAETCRWSNRYIFSKTKLQIEEGAIILVDCSSRCWQRLMCG